MNRQDISKLSKNRPIFLKVGFAISIGLMILAFNIKASHYENPDLAADSLVEEPEINIVRTPAREARQLPPPVVTPSEKMPESDMPDFSEEPALVAEDLSLSLSDVAVREGTPAVKSRMPAPEAPPVIREPAPEVDDIFKVVEEMPRFAGCEVLPTQEDRRRCSDRAVLQYVAQHIRYPNIARTNGIEGLVVVQFVIEKDGTVSGARIVRDIGGGCGREALRIVDGMPSWSPGTQRGRPVRVMINLPVRFQLQ